ncbi:myb/SANT-like DNA-binding domain-containing protein 4 isoform X2 [Homarus americanus]|uniref:Regulatory protein zeste n=1 Tax=Homarus americanus TaxID=6706 RepID=A0A8J5JI57_HOMAM|nr:myb/SANT-like DNA-binding domain-containing protein 4 isoform X2 [Homarus americanus]KAG7156528.1 t-SNARE domain-containing protein 1-like 1 [Homarus americanus]
MSVNKESFTPVECRTILQVLDSGSDEIFDPEKIDEDDSGDGYHDLTALDSSTSRAGVQDQQVRSQVKNIQSQDINKVDGVARACWPNVAELTKSSTNLKRKINQLESMKVVAVSKQKMEGPTAKRRRPNFCEEEVHAMLREIAKRKKMILGKLDSRNTVTLKNHAWEEVLKAVNAVARIPRSVAEVRRKFSDLRVSVKKKAAQDKKYPGGTGGDPHFETTYTSIEEAVLQLLESVSIHGIPGILENEEPIDEEEREPTPAPSGVRFTAIHSREESRFRPVQEKEDSLTIILTEDMQEHEITVPIELIEPETSSHQSSQESSSSTEQRSRSHTPSATAEVNQTRSTLTCDPTDEPGPSPLPSTRQSKSISDRRPRTHSALKHAYLIPEVLQVQSQMRDSLVELVNSVQEVSTNMVKLVANTECIASALQTIAKAVQSKSPTHDTVCV